MDVFSHGLWGGIAFGRRRKRDFWAAVLFGMLPDLISFGPFFLMALLGVIPLRFGGPPSLDIIPQFVFFLYSVTHSLIVFALVFGAVWARRKRAYVPLAAWGLHILVDIPTHSTQFFPTPFLWPLSSVHVNGVPWSHPMIFFTDVVFLIVLYVWFFVFKGGWKGINKQDEAA